MLPPSGGRDHFSLDVNGRTDTINGVLTNKEGKLK